MLLQKRWKRYSLGSWEWSWLFCNFILYKMQRYENAKKLLNGYKGKLIAKIEKFDAVANIDEIIEASDGLMVARVI